MVFLTLFALLIIAAPAYGDDCERQCGNVSVPYPFGTTPGCYRDPDFLITCNQSIPYVRHTNIDVTYISIKGQLFVMKYIDSDCYSPDGERLSDGLTSINLAKFMVSDTQNKFVAVGCDTYAYFKGYLRNNHSYGTGCISVCSDIDNVRNGSCSGIGCCETSIPKGVGSFNLFLSSYNNHTDIRDFNPCSYAFVVQKDKFNFSSEYIRNITDEKLPLVLDWAIGNVSCEEAKMNLSYACKDNSNCFDAENGSGYICICNEGYDGNPYADGCYDIDECSLKTNNCSQHCRNTPGNYTCSCNKGYHGDGLKHGTGCIANQSQFLKIMLGTSIICIVLLVCFSWLYFGLKRRKMILLKEQFFRQNGGFMLQKKLSRQKKSSDKSDKQMIYSAEELKRATNNYHESRIIGKGGYGIVYRGVLTNNKTVAIKKSKVMDESQIEQFINEVLLLSQIEHKNVVKLFGCCLETQVPLLVYEFINNGTLFDHLHNQTKACLLSWEIRLRIARETAEVLSYLHSSISTPIIHRDIKPRNILLDDNYTAKVSDFGASRLVPKDQDELSTVVQGTMGYLDPEYLRKNELNEKSDVYSFGVLLVELLTGKKALCFQRPLKQRNLATYFISSLQECRLFTIIDEQVMREANDVELKKVSMLAKRCLSVKGEERPFMKEVAMELEGLRVQQNHSSANLDLYPEDSKYFLGEISNHEANEPYNSITTEYDSLVIENVCKIDGGR